jgi:hypothetical protein
VKADIISAIHSPALFKPWFRDLETWRAWFSLLRAIFALPMDAADLDIYRQCTGRTDPPSAPVTEAWLCVGRRGGKSQILATVAVFLAVFRDWSDCIVPGESATIQVIAVDRKQARIIYRYARAMLMRTPALKHLVASENGDTIELTNGLSLEITTASYRSVRGYTIVAALCDEIAFWRFDDSSANPDREILDALRPSMATVPGALLLCASSPYAKRGVLYQAHRQHYGKDASNVLVWQAPTRTMNPSLPQAVVDEAYERDPASAAAEYGGLFRDDIAAFVTREVIDACTVPGRYELPRLSEYSYVAFVDPSGGSSDSMTLAIAHVEGERGDIGVLDAVREIRPPFSPESVVKEFAALLEHYDCREVEGDRYAGEWVREPFNVHGSTYTVAEKSKSDIFRDTLPLYSSGKVELLDHPRLAAQLCNLERRTARGGRDSIDHPPGAHDDIANAACGALLRAVSHASGLWVWERL